VGPFDGRFCPQCGGGLTLALNGITSIPLDARWLDHDHAPADAPEVTVVDLRCKRDRAGKTGKRIVKELGDYFAVRANRGSVKVSVNRGVPAEAALRVAAVLDGVDSDWEQHFYLPTAGPQDPPHDSQRRPSRLGHLRLVASNGDGIRSEGP
jgi:hypothetical protein